jgi:hypothetical protein
MSRRVPPADTVTAFKQYLARGGDKDGPERLITRLDCHPSKIDAAAQVVEIVVVHGRFSIYSYIWLIPARPCVAAHIAQCSPEM